MTKVIIGFSEPNKWMIGAAALKLWMRAPYCHVYLRVYSKYTSQWLVYHASHGMVHCITYTNFKAGNNIVREFNVWAGDEDLQATVRLAQQYLGQPYGYFGLLKLVLRRIGLGVKGDKNRSSHCSEFIATLFPKLALKSKIDPDFIEPTHLYAALEESNG
jgi:hypothetical protein